MKYELVNRYLNAFGRLNRATKNGIKAPHKPILLLSVIQSISNGEIKENKIEITPQLVARFKDNWNWLVREDFFKPSFVLPFYHLISDKFWHLHTYIGKEILLTNSGSIKSFLQLKEVVEYAFLDEYLFNLLLNSDSRDALHNFLIEYYFKVSPPLMSRPELFDEVANQILHNSAREYQYVVDKADEEEIFIRSGVFKRVIPFAYNYTCCISGMRIISGYDIQMVDACHIIPFGISHSDTISNGICLSPNFHRAFDRGLIAVDNDYRVIVSTSFTENSKTNGIKMYEGKQILLPKEKSYHPSLENFEVHKNKWFKKS